MTRAKSLAVDHFHAPILRPRRLVIAVRRGPFGAEADGGQLRFRNPLKHQRAPHCLCAALAESDVVLTNTAFVGVALELYLRVRMNGQIARMTGHDIGELR